MDLRTFLFVCTLFIFACKSEQNSDSKIISSFDEDKELTAIMAVIVQETDCFFKGDYDCWSKTWSHQPYALQAWNNSDGTSDAAQGWDRINAQGKNWIETYYKNGEVIIHPDVKKTKPMVKFFNENSAYLLWKQYNADKDKKYYIVSTESRIMEKDTEGWKIVNVSGFWSSEKKIHADSLPNQLQ